MLELRTAAPRPAPGVCGAWCPSRGQLVRRDDSVLGPYSRWPLRGLNVDYETLIRRAFQPRWWASPQAHPRRRGRHDHRRDPAPTATRPPTSSPLLEYNFSLFFGLAVQEYEATLVSDRHALRSVPGQPDRRAAAGRRRAGASDLLQRERRPPPRAATASSATPASLLSEASVDFGQRRPTRYGPDLRADSRATAGRATSASGRRRTTSATAASTRSGPRCRSRSATARRREPSLAADGTFKIPGLRNVELTAPYFHNGGEATLTDVVDFYARGGNQGGATNPIKTRDGTVVTGLSVLNFNTSPDAGREGRPGRVPQVTHRRAGPHRGGAVRPSAALRAQRPSGRHQSVTQQNGQALDSLLEIPATGKYGGAVLPGFLEKD